MEYNEIINLMQEMTKTGLSRIKIEKDDFKLVLEKNNINAQAMQVPVTEGFMRGDGPANNAMTKDAMVNGARVNNENTENAHIDNAEDKKEMPGTRKILSPMVGTFYGQPAPDKSSYVNVGDVVKKGQTVCIIEAMKLMNEIESELEGEIIECLVENEDMVEFGQPLFLVK